MGYNGEDNVIKYLFIPQLSCETTVGDYFCLYSTKTNILKTRFKRVKYQS